MANDFQYDVFLSHSLKDKPLVRAIAERLRTDGLRVWLDEWQIKPGDSIPAKIEEGLEHSRVLVLCMSAHTFGSDWATLESQTFLFRDPLNKQRRFIPLRFDDATLTGSLAQFSYIDWRSRDIEQEYAKLLEACRSSVNPPVGKAPAVGKYFAEKATQLDYTQEVWAYAFSPEGNCVLTGAGDGTVRLWDLEVGCCLRVLEGHKGSVTDVAWGADQRRALCCADRSVLLWDVEGRQCLRVLAGHMGNVQCVAWSADQRRALSGAGDGTVRLWDVEAGRCLRVLEAHTGFVNSVAWSADHRRALSGASP
jgi:hypothetical protein